MADVKKTLSTGFKVLLGLLAVVAIILIIWGGTWLVNNLPTGLSSIGSTASATPINAPVSIETVLKVVLGSQSIISWENLILSLAIFMILFFAMSDIVALFSTFTETTSWVIGGGLAVIAGVTNIVEYIAGVFAITAGIGAVGISIIIITAVFAAVVLNLGIRGPLKSWQNARQIEIDRFKAEKGFSKVSDFIRGAKSGAEAAAS